jgi:hypothetical protein
VTKKYDWSVFGIFKLLVVSGWLLICDALSRSIRASFRIPLFEEQMYSSLGRHVTVPQVFEHAAESYLSWSFFQSKKKYSHCNPTLGLEHDSRILAENQDG